ncbi:DUF1109 family protein [Klenkia brasiliensis]|uniref:Uncharacterized protein n=1 Tax=Klenkia brasiliensis TaxID=333142 RepID=A0A1G7PJX4_9ACTN|nr:DUF1109 family protein [Klenkia brasiliensis]SDF85969.1 Protein of unknown function [Klenkia brasiliensis]
MKNARAALVMLGSLLLLLTLVQGYRVGVRTDLFDTGETVFSVEVVAPAVLAVFAFAAAWKSRPDR